MNSLKIGAFLLIFFQLFTDRVQATKKQSKVMKILKKALDQSIEEADEPENEQPVEKSSQRKKTRSGHK